MKRILMLGVILAVIWGIGYLYATDIELIEFKGGATKTAGQNWLTASDNYYPPACWYDTTALNDTLTDTTYSSYVYLGNGTLEKLVVKYYFSSTDTFAEADTGDSATLLFQFSTTSDFASTWTSSWAIAKYALSNATAYTTITPFTETDTMLLNYPGYNYARCRIIYRCVWDSTTWEATTANCAADVFTEHAPITFKTAYYPIWK